MEEDEDDLRYSLEMMCIDDPYSFDEANELYSVVAGIIGMK